MFGVQSAGAVQEYDEAFGAVALYVSAVPAQPEPGPVITACPGMELMVTLILPEVPLPQLFDGVTVIFPELPGVDEKLDPDPVFGDQSAGAVQLNVEAFDELAVNVSETPEQPDPGPVTVAAPGTEVIVIFLLSAGPFPQLFDGVTVIFPEAPGVDVNVVPDPVFGDHPAGAVQLNDVALVEDALKVSAVPAHAVPAPEIVAAPGMEDIDTLLLPVEPTPQEFDGKAVTFPELPGVDVNVAPDPVFGTQSAGAVQTKAEAFVEVALNVNETPAQPEPGPVTVAGPGRELTVTFLLPGVPLPQPLEGVTVMFPELPGVEINVVPEPVFGDQSAGAVQLNDVAFDELALNVNATPVQPEAEPETVAGPGKVVIVTLKLPVVPFPQILEGVAVTFPELPGVEVNVDPEPVFGDQPAGAVQLNDVAFEEVALNVIGVPPQPELEPVTAAAPGTDAVTVTLLLPAEPVPQLLDGVAVTVPELPGVDVKLVPDPVVGDQPAGAVQLNDVALEELAVNVNGDPAQPEPEPVTVATPGTDVAMVTGVLVIAPFPQLLDGVTVIVPELPGVVVNEVPDPEVGDHPVGAVQL